MESDEDNEIQEYDRIVKESIKEGLFDEQEEEFDCDISIDLDIFNGKASLCEDKLENLNKFNVYFNLKLNEKNEIIFLIESDDLNIDTQCVSDLIFNIVHKINSKNININYENNVFLLSLKEYDNIDLYNNNYELRSCDKLSHAPKYDCPCFSSEIILDELIDREICFVVKNLSNIKLSEKSDEERKIVEKTPI